MIKFTYLLKGFPDGQAIRKATDHNGGVSGSCELQLGWDGIE